MAIRTLEIVVRRLAGPTYVYHEIVHNRHVVERFERLGVTFVDEVAEVPVGAVLVFSAHGVSPAVREQARCRGLRTIDATCPLVAKVHTEIVRFVAAGYQVVLVGHAGHDEVLGTMGEAPQQTYLVGTPLDVESLPMDSSAKLAFLTQTTLSVDETERVIAALRKRFPSIVGPPSDDICYATQNRQESVRLLAQEVDVMLVVGSNNSSNSHRLREVADEQGVAAYLVDDAQGLKEAWFVEQQVVGITAGASAPEASVKSVVEWLGVRFATEVISYGAEEPLRVFPLPGDVQQLLN